MNSQISDKKNETRAKLMNKLLPYLRKNGLQSVRMDEISRVMEISRATLYKYFSTKEEIVEFIVDGFIEYMKELTHNPLDSVQSFGTRFLQIFEQTISLVVYFSDIILQDLETSYPDLFDRFNEAMKEREEKILAFFEEGKQKGIFNQLNGRLLIKQDEILRGMFDVKFLMTNQFTVQQVLYDYFQLKRIQLFKPEKLTAIDDEVLMPKIEHLTQKVTKNLF
ncbi:MULTISPECIES: TetR/AcrR family transcriptional regulator [Paenibacillaceae]|uniref:TetR family transcriptional regulator n=3 Tax=Paenibacillaceae TaxID=186822 RepID=A0A917D520_9BACL|nr:MULTISPECIES: TetR/AcrR family transcriptional regulator [Paenibacillaceae]MCP3794608.1 TetR/AcrR family transcriptional regulator [Paenibacillus sp. CH40]MBC9204036.1 TetR/AcrR family transcriptional regulator [Paenibacillus sp. PL91]MDQ0049896.1 AcrR family transcriptional regulator [Paenibacillus polymyxa]RCX23411.1 TetR family transcriptional regulator [Fontibacillus phaseoli]GGG10938.1 TetR family transcriptional regulator [Paenibacillus albidus]